MRILSYLLRLYCSTWKVSKGESYFSDINRSAILVSWHEDILSLLWCNRKEDIVPIVSRSRDGDLLCTILHSWGYKEMIRGSSSSGGREALASGKRSLDNGLKVAFALDGPRGPRHEPKPGAVLLSSRAGKPIVLLTARASSSYRFSSWDHFCLPMPFAKIELRSELWMPACDLSVAEALMVLRQRMAALRSQSLPLDG